MAESFSERISSLKQQTDEDKARRLRFSTALLRTFPCMLALALLLNQFSGSAPEIKESDTNEQRWQKQTSLEFEDNIQWLSATPFFSPMGRDIYEGYAQTIVSTFHVPEKKTNSDEVVSFPSLFASASRRFTTVWLRAGFVLIAFWPIWLTAFLVGYFGFRHRYWGKRTEDLLGACDKGLGPFYSGIYGPLRTNNSFSATDHSCPNLACLEMVKPELALSHRLGQLLKQYGALNQTNIDLARVILRYSDFPSFVEGEQSKEEEADTGELVEKAGPGPDQGFVTNAEGSIETSSMAGLESTLSAHAALKQYVSIAMEKKLTNAQLNTSLALHHEILGPLMSVLSPEGQQLAGLLSPNRVWALGHVPATMIASAYLATEAGKCLVYKRDGNRFARISRYPHLQARAVIQSLVSYGKDYSGDSRLIIRQAVISSRRHGDFGRAFMPDKMSVEGRALRDWLEVMYDEPGKREAVSRLVELDAHIEELSINWRFVYSRRIRQDVEIGSETRREKLGRFWKGMVYKSVVLVPLNEVVNTALKNVDDLRVKRISELLDLTRRYQTSLSVSTRLPGFKHQALDAQNPTDLFTDKEGQALFDRWVLVRRMLRRYNWLSTRVGDDAVPSHGLVQALVVTPDIDTGKPDLAGFDMLVPIRQRRYEEMFGRQWESLFFTDSPHPANIRVFVDLDKFKQSFKREQDNLRKLTPLKAVSA